jgi:hypothetical protein
MTTEKDLELLLKVSKVSIYTMLKKDLFKGHVFKGENNITLIDDIGVELLKAHYLKEQGKTLQDIIEDEINHSKAASKADSKDDDEVNNPDIIRFLQHELEARNEQINSLLTIVLNQQKLQATQLLTNKQGMVNSDQPDDPPPKESFFKRIFKKK